MIDNKTYKLLSGRIDSFTGTGVSIGDGYNADIVIFNDNTKEAYILNRKLGIEFKKRFDAYTKENTVKEYTIEFFNGKSQSGKIFTSIKNIIFRSD